MLARLEGIDAREVNSLRMFAETGMAALRERSLALTGYLIFGGSPSVKQVEVWKLIDVALGLALIVMAGSRLGKRTSSGRGIA